MDNQPMVATAKESLIQRQINAIDIMCDKLAQYTGRLCDITDKFIGPYPEQSLCTSEKDIDNPGISGLLESSIRRMADRVDRVECQVMRLVDSGVI